MKDDLSDISKIEVIKDHPVSSQIDEVFRAVIKEKKPMVKKESNPSVPSDLPSLPSGVALSDGEFALDFSNDLSNDLSNDNQETKDPSSAVDDFELSLDNEAEIRLGEEERDENELSVSGYNEISLEDSDEGPETSDELSTDVDSSGEVIENLGELSFDDDAGDINLSDIDDSETQGPVLDELDLGQDEKISNLEEQNLSEVQSVSIDFAQESLGQIESDQNESELDLAAFSNSSVGELSDDAKKKLIEIDKILVLDASRININQSVVDEKSLDEPLVSEDLDLGSLNFSGEEPVVAPLKEEKIRKKKREPDAKENEREVGEELREISGAYAVEMERLQATLSNLRVDRQELLSKIQKFEEDKMLHSRQMLSLQAELDEKRIEMTIIRKKLNEEIVELRDRMRVQDERRLILDEKNRFLSQELEKSSQKSKIDVKKVQLRERELEQKLELLKADAETQIRYRDQKILELKRKIDAMEFDMESISQQEKKSVESRFELEDKLEKAIKTLRSAINVLENEPDRVDALKALKKNIDM